MRKIENCEPLYYGDIRNLANDYEQDTAYKVEPVLACLRTMHRHIQAGREYQFFEQGGNIRIINSVSFREFILKYFNERVYCNICGISVPRRSSKPVRADFMTFRKKLNTDEIFTYEDILSLTETYKTDSDTDCERVIKTLHMLYDFLSEGKTYEFYDISGTLNELTPDSFNSFVLRFFDGRMHLWVLNEIKANQ